MSRRCHICQSDLLYERRHFIRHKAIWWEATTQVIKPTYFTQSFPCRSKVQLRANLITHQRSTLRRCTTHICSYLRSRLIRREKFEKFSGSLFKSTTSYTYSKSDSSQSEQTVVPLFLHRDGVICIIISVAKLKRKDEKRQSWRTLVWVKDRHKYELGFGCSHADWIS